MKTLKNRVQLIGHLGADPEITELTDGKTVAKLSLATS
ncbi:single-stranded DNA-binding protein, partial [Candidatus Wolfebacteria bacterium]